MTSSSIFKGYINKSHLNGLQFVLKTVKHVFVGVDRVEVTLKSRDVLGDGPSAAIEQGPFEQESLQGQLRKPSMDWVIRLYTSGTR